MILKNEIQNLRSYIYAEPHFRLSRNQIELRIIRGQQVKQPDETWMNIPNSEREENLVVISDDIQIDIRTLKRAILQDVSHVNDEQEVVIDVAKTPDQYVYPAYSFMMGSTPRVLGLQTVDEYIYPVIATQVEKYLQENNCIGSSY